MKSKDAPVRVVALGGGYATINVLKSLKGHIASGRVHLTVIDKNNYHVFHGLVAEMLTVEVPAAEGVPEINPVEVLRVRPAGNPVAPNEVGLLLAEIW